jgi:hypothetical protein
MSPRERLFLGKRAEESGGGDREDAAGTGKRGADHGGPHRGGPAGKGRNPGRLSTSGVRQGPLLGIVAIVALVALVATSLLHDPGGLRGIEPGTQLPPFAVPLAIGNLKGDANIARHAHEGESGNVPACSVRGSQILNVCQLLERGPLVLALFVDERSCPRVLGEMQALKGSFPGVQFAAVSIKGKRSNLRHLIARDGLTLPIGIDADGALASLFKVLSCPQVNFVYRGGKVQSRALLSTPTAAALRSRIASLVAASQTRATP